MTVLMIIVNTVVNAPNRVGASALIAETFGTASATLAPDGSVASNPR
jgi:hypothetical protein